MSHMSPIPPMGRWSPVVPRAEEIIRDAKLKVLQHHYETAFAEFMEIEKALVTASSEERETLAAKAKALRGFADRLEDEIRKLGDNELPTTTAPTRRNAGDILLLCWQGRPSNDVKITAF